MKIPWRAAHTKPFQNKVVLITGGSRGLGLLLATRFAKGGADLVICARNKEELEEAKKRLEAEGAHVLALVCDVTKSEDLESLVHLTLTEFGQVDVLVNNASVIDVGPLENFSERDFREAMEVNFWGAANLTLALLPYLAENAGSRIVNITSIGGVVPVPHLIPYTVAKFAAFGFSQGIQSELSRRGIRVTTVVPGLMRTGSFYQAQLKGNRKAEFKWFTLGSSLPLVSMDAERAAKRIILACIRGERMVTLGLPAKTLRIAYALFPTVVSRILSLVNRALPLPAGSKDEDWEKGWQHPSALTRSAVTGLGRKAAQRFNQGHPKRRAG